ncbi:MAG: hypothetical protein M0027_07200 [Candidatus Dormibacteraeota bacterium]|nr:hypothetical protein [Candidatus Dormibacteraeota bacterium]
MSGRPGQSQAEYYRGVPTAPYDLIKEISVVLVVMLVVVLALAFFLSSPDVPPVTVQSWAEAQPLGLLQTATSELQGTSFSADYGPPYNHGSGAIQTLGPLQPQVWAGIHQPVDPARDDVLAPLRLASVGRPQLKVALDSFEAAPAGLKHSWLNAYAAALQRARSVGPTVTVPTGSYGPVNTMMQGLLEDARSGALDSLLMQSGQFYDTNYTGPLLFLGDGDYFTDLAASQKLNGTQWGMMNETGRYPGQSWLWLYTFWYQIPPFSTASNADLMVVLIMGFLSTLLVLVPFIPGLRDLPAWLHLPQLVWREHYALLRSSGRRSKGP